MLQNTGKTQSIIRLQEAVARLRAIDDNEELQNEFYEVTRIIRSLPGLVEDVRSTIERSIEPMESRMPYHRLDGTPIYGGCAQDDR